MAKGVNLKKENGKVSKARKVNLVRQTREP